MINRGDDQTDRFIDEGIWEHDFDDNSKVLAQVRSMQTGERWSQRLEVTSGELLPDQPVPLLKRRFELTREEALRLWAEKRQQGWQACEPQWALPTERPPRDGPQVTSMGRSASPPCF